MTLSPASSYDLEGHEQGAAGRADPAGLPERMREELRELEPVVSAATLVSVAFRMRDEGGLVAALRNLAQAIDELERVRREA
jgi:hypothetical protein